MRTSSLAIPKTNAHIQKTTSNHLNNFTGFCIPVTVKNHPLKSIYMLQN